MTLKKLTIRTTGGDHTITLQNYDDTTDIEFWGDAYDKALSGKLRSRARGLRQFFRISYGACIEASEYRDLYNDIVADLTTGNDSFSISEGSTIDDIVVVTVTDTFRQQVQYASTIGFFAPVIEFVSVDINATMGTTYVETGYITNGYVQ